MQVYAPPRDPTAVMGRRIGAYVIDAFITTVLLVVLFTAMAQRTDKTDTVFQGTNVCPTVRATTNRNFCFEGPNTVYTLTNSQALVAFGLPLLVSFANLVLLQGAGGASVGKHLLGLRVVDGNGNPANIGRAFIRWLLLLVDAACLIVGLIVASVTTPHRRVGDFAAGTYVVARSDVGYRPDEPAYGPRPDRSSFPQAQAQPQPQPVGAYGMSTGAPVQPGMGAPAQPAMQNAPVWDAQRGAWVVFDPYRQGWLRYDDAARQWVPL